MKNQQEPAIKAGIGDGLQAHFNTIEDYLILGAATQKTYGQFQSWYRNAYPNVTPSRQTYKEYKDKVLPLRMERLLRENKTSDGRTLLEYFTEKRGKT
jgi:hypothetical protein